MVNVMSRLDLATGAQVYCLNVILDVCDGVSG